MLRKTLRTESKETWPVDVTRCFRYCSRIMYHRIKGRGGREKGKGEEWMDEREKK